ncbi:hypothetical protein CROQUDRAFT_53138 [Cronartium quercuum f. sp. fusiforme G11]|uniref:Uncharacterized protein n=1 Tax=Cronartium quercuum f. sp. fusiforme G11 TaxID=708437 RepID=A0A9P6N6G6_9BASI|nr:hypothetical protein CROQUDRAFT_53138 [Cronartium quercuum f. sp. fusiforme G11]
MKHYLKLLFLTAYGLKRAHAESDDTTAFFGRPFKIAGANVRSEVAVSNEFTIDAYSATVHTITVTRNHPSATADYVTPLDPSSTAIVGRWVALNKYSYKVEVDNGQTNADDMIVKLEAKYDPTQLQAQKIPVSDVYLGMYNSTRSGWVIDTERANVQLNENHARIIGLNAPAGEYMLLGRITPNLQNFFIQFASASSGTTNWTVNAPPSRMGTLPLPLQVGVWVDGLRMLIRSPEQIIVQADIRAAPAEGLPSGYMVVCKC